MCTTGDDVTGTNGMCRARDAAAERGNIDSGTAALRPTAAAAAFLSADSCRRAVVSLSEPSANRRRTPGSRRPVYARCCARYSPTLTHTRTPTHTRHSSNALTPTRKLTLTHHTHTHTRTNKTVQIYTRIHTPTHTVAYSRANDDFCMHANTT